MIYRCDISLWYIIINKNANPYRCHFNISLIYHSDMLRKLGPGLNSIFFESRSPGQYQLVQFSSNLLYYFSRNLFRSLKIPQRLFLKVVTIRYKKKVIVTDPNNILIRLWPPPTTVGAGQSAYRIESCIPHIGDTINSDNYIARIRNQKIINQCIWNMEF